MNRRSSVALTAELHAELTTHLVRADGQEDLCFAIWFPSEGARRTSALLHHAVLPVAGERRVHGNASFLPAYFERALDEAMAAGGGLAFLHSHGGPGWQGMSDDDVRAEESHAAATFGATGLPLVGLTLGTDGAWSARTWVRTGPRRYARSWCESVRVVGEQLRVTYHDGLRPAPRPREELRRTISAWGPEAQAHLARLRVGIVGGGSVGSIVAEALARTGIEHVILVDFDSVERVNLDRLLHATIADVGRAKVRVLGDGLRRGATAERFAVDEVEFGVGEETGFRAALDCDILFSCVDRPWPRSVLNAAAYAHLIPVIDGGIDVTTTNRGTLRGADWRAHVAGPDHRCLECIGQYDPGLVSADREGYFDDPTYIRSLQAAGGVRGNENVFGFSLAVASLEVLQLLSMVVAPAGVPNPGGQLYHFVQGVLESPCFDPCEPTCLYPGLTARGDRAGLELTARHLVAEAKRAERLAREATARPLPVQAGLLRRLWGALVKTIHRSRT
jgi:molybdopterin/thiamine biosynthesis adenylyltransferase